MPDPVFKYAQSVRQDSVGMGNCGRGLFVAETDMPKMRGTIVAENAANGVNFILTLQRGIN